MTKSIRWRMVTIFVLLVIIVMIVSGTLIVYQTRYYEYNLIENELVSTANGIKKSVATDQPVTEIESAIEEVIAEYDSSSKNIKYFVLDHKGNVIYQSVATSEKRIYSAQVIAALSDNLSTNNEFDDGPEIGDGLTYIGHATNIIKDDVVVFVVYIVSSTQQVQEKIWNMVEVIIYALLLAIVLSIILAFLFSSFLTKPISALTSKAREMAKGNLANPIEVFSNDEIGELTVNFNRMASSLNETLDEIAGEKNKMETVITHMTDGILVFDNYGILIHKNPAAVRMLKLVDVINFTDVFDGKLGVKFSTLLQEVELNTQRLSLVLADFYYSVDIAKYLDVDGTTLGIICVIQDITEHKELEKKQKEFVANVSHELRTPLTTIKSYTETLLEGALDDLEVASRFLGVINNESDRMTVLVQDLLELSKLDNKSSAFKDEIIDLGQIVRRSVENYNIHARHKFQTLTLEGGGEERFISGDSNRIEQVIKNLLSNAVKYSQENAVIKVSITSNQRYHIVKVIDNGMGMPEEDLPYIFDRFYRVDKARSRAMGGTGLGLAIAKEIIELHKGKIEAFSKLDKGTTFTISLPIYDEDNVIK